ncbi:MAG: hypothetical protein K0S09_2221 [Sphingobacteriaceae bacterium]|jgi:signal transduction histidine kinase|nr:hypothetical protein [Sphingobacteriaceae bacterium]
MDLKLIAALYHRDLRQDAAKRLASYFDSDNLIIFINDPEINILLPGPGFIQTLPNGKAWQNFLASCQTGYHQGVLEQPEGMIQVTGFPDEERKSIAVFIGGTPRREELEPLYALMPLIGSLLRHEQSILANQSLAIIAEKTAAKAERLASTIDSMRQQLRRALSQQEDDKEAIQQLMYKKDEFLNVASHELKTPLTSLKAYMQLLEKTVAGTKANVFVSKSMNQIKRLERLVQDLLDVSRISSGKLIYSLDRFDMADAIREVVSGIQLSVTHKLIIESNPSVVLNGDRHRIEQVITNFLINAIKYSPDADKVIISSELIDNNLVVAIRDFGIGIAAEHLGSLFDRFYRVDNTAMKFEGLGLGLYIASEILGRHKGSFWIESTLGEGSTFYFRLPVADASALPGLEDERHYVSDKLDIRCDENSGLLRVDWKGFPDLQSVEQGSKIILEMLRKNRCSKVLYNTMNVLGGPSGTVDWVAKEWLPDMETAGLKQFAWIYSKERFSKLSADKSMVENAAKIATKSFSSIEDAYNWLFPAV